MINRSKIKFNEPTYYVPSYSSAVRVSILKYLSGDMFLVKPYSSKKDFKPYPTHIEYIFNDEESANHSCRDWEKYMKQYKKNKKSQKKGAKN